LTSCIACRQIEEQAVHRALHGYQQQLVDCVSKGQNHIIVAPTGSGKTRVAVEVAGLLFLRKPSARILFLTPTVALAEQQTGEHRTVCTQACRQGLAIKCSQSLYCMTLCGATCNTAIISVLLCIAPLVGCCLQHQDIMWTVLHLTQRHNILHNMQGGCHSLHTYLFRIRHLPRDFLIPFAVVTEASRYSFVISAVLLLM
jgi:hypothetical protein